MDLHSIIVNSLAADNYTIGGSLFEYDDTDFFHAYHKSDVEYKNHNLNGPCLEIFKVYRHNGTQTDVNYKLQKVIWINGNGHVADTLKVLHTQSAETIDKKIKAFTKGF